MHYSFVESRRLAAAAGEVNDDHWLVVLACNASIDRRDMYQHQLTHEPLMTLNFKAALQFVNGRRGRIGFKPRLSVEGITFGLVKVQIIRHFLFSFMYSDQRYERIRHYR